MNDLRWDFVRVLDRDETGDTDIANSLGDDIDGIVIVTPDLNDDGDGNPQDATPDPVVTNTNAFSMVTAGSNTAVADQLEDNLTFIAGDNISIEVDPGADSVTISATDDAAITEITNILDGTNIVDVSGASSTNAIDVPLGDIAYVSPTELYLYVGVGDPVANPISVNDIPSNFFYDTPINGAAGSQVVPDGWLRIGQDQVDTNSVIEVPTTGASLTNGIFSSMLVSVAWISDTHSQLAND